MNKKKNSLENEFPVKSPEKLKYPKSIFFIIGTEFCERFSYYGMRTVLVLYFKNVFLYTDNTATLWYHIFVMVAYFTPIFGAIISDSFWGKFKTIFYISILYSIGNIVLSLASVWGNIAVTFIGLILIAFGTGGVKPNVSAFGGDQFRPGQEKQLQQFFSLFYFTINAGSFVSTLLTPFFREDVKCIERDTGDSDCFPLAFGVPSVLMILAVTLFGIGKFVTGYTLVPPAKGSIVVETVRVIFHALGNKMSSKTGKKDHWLDHAEDKYDKNLIGDVKAIMKVLFLYLPLPIFWALYDQQGSRWQLQALRMDGDFFGVYRIKPDQMQVFNPFLVLLLIPFFQYVVYPLLAKIGIAKKPLQRMIIGGLLAALAFVICGFFQLKIEEGLPVEPSEGQTHLTIINGLPCTIKIKNDMIGDEWIILEPLVTHNTQNVRFIQEANQIEISGNTNVLCNIKNETKYSGTFHPTIDNKILVLLISNIDEDDKVKINEFAKPDLLIKPNKVAANLTLFFNNIDHINDTTFILENEEYSYTISPYDINGNITGVTVNETINIDTGGNYKLSIKNGNNIEKIDSDFELKQGGGYILMVGRDETTKYSAKLHISVEPNNVKMLWLVVQYVVICSGEIMFSITGLEFSYSQAPKSMKSVLTAAWLLTTAFGNLIVTIVASVEIFGKQSLEFFFFAALMVVDMAIYAIMAYYYVPNTFELNKNSEETDDYKHNPNAEKSQTNHGFDDDEYTKI